MPVILVGVALCAATATAIAQEPCPPAAWIFWEETATRVAGSTVWQPSNWNISSTTYESRDACLELRRNLWKTVYDGWKDQERGNRIGIGTVETVVGNEVAADIHVSYRDRRGFKVTLYCLPASIDPRPRQ